MATFHTKPTSRRAVVTVVVGNATVEASNLAPQVNAIAVVPVIEIQSFWPFEGVPVKLVVNDVIAVDWPVMMNVSVVSVLIAGVAVLAVLVVTRGTVFANTPVKEGSVAVPVPLDGTVSVMVPAGVWSKLIGMSHRR